MPTESECEQLELAIRNDDVDTLERLIHGGLNILQQFSFSTTSQIPLCLASNLRSLITMEYLLDLHISNKKWHLPVSGEASPRNILCQTIMRFYSFTIIVDTYKRIIAKLCKLMSIRGISACLFRNNCCENSALLQLLIDLGADVSLFQDMCVQPCLRANINPSCLLIFLQNGFDLTRFNEGAELLGKICTYAVWRKNNKKYTSLLCLFVSLERQKYKCLQILFAFWENMPVELPNTFSSSDRTEILNIQAQVERARVEVRARYLAFCMGSHARLGSNSRVFSFSEEYMNMILNNFKYREELDTLDLLGLQI